MEILKDGGPVHPYDEHFRFGIQKARLLLGALDVIKEFAANTWYQRRAFMNQRIEKGEAIARMKHRPSGAALDRKSTHFANINSQKEVWWFDIPCSKIAVGAAEDINLVLFDHRTNELHHLIVPSEYFRANLRGLVVRHEKGTISLELSAEPRTMFQDVRPTGNGIQFAQFEQR